MTTVSVEKELESKLGHSFKNRALLNQALTHSSRTRKALGDNKRFEFLGDRVLNLVIAELLSEKHPEASVGELAPKFNLLVSGDTCAKIAATIDLGSALKLGRAEQRAGGRSKIVILGDAMEAVIGAIYLDAGFNKAVRIVRKLWEPVLADAEGDTRNPKSALQELTQGQGLGAPVYRVINRIGPSHKPEFEVEATLSSGERAVARESSKQRAEQLAARELLETLE